MLLIVSRSFLSRLSSVLLCSFQPLQFKLLNPTELPTRRSYPIPNEFSFNSQNRSICSALLPVRPTMIALLLLFVSCLCIQGDLRSIGWPFLGICLLEHLKFHFSGTGAQGQSRRELRGAAPAPLPPATLVTVPAVPSLCNVSISFGQPSSDPSAVLGCLPLLSALGKPPYKAPGSKLSFTLVLQGPAWAGSNAAPSPMCAFASSQPATAADRQALYRGLAAASPWSLPNAAGGPLGTDCQTSVVAVVDACLGVVLALRPPGCADAPLPSEWTRGPRRSHRF